MRNILIAIISSALFVQANAQIPPTTAPTSQPTQISASDKAAIDLNMGKDTVVQGTVTSANWSPSGKVFRIEFQETDDSQFQAVIFEKDKDVMEKAFNGDLTAALSGAKVQIHGKLKTYRERPEIAIDSPDQITILQKAPTTAPSSTTQPSSTPPN